ncbi:CRISPR-associated RAMP protein Csx7 [Ammonifex thiophilus]|uniref:CRISPR-associated RAMP protein n=1 Tax=Ammonifex thiophilus TaxID=444093 RepID=A0A3D8P6E7_9THEO|nr:CRISPR-associated RAMP protein Csx7 [Ammonifex thiophilus]RDV83584.1 CRISPR-associated RAMP protein [Ammonifex thiophilus]
MSLEVRPPLWDTFINRLIIRGELVCQTALRIGAGSDPLLPTASDLPILLLNGQPYIPGSSLRGVLRSHLERLVRTLEPSPGGGKGACNPVDKNEWCIKTEDMRELRQSKKDLAFRVWDKSCRICRLFGSPWLASRVRVSDLFCLDENVKPQIRDGVAIDREKEAVRNKFDFEVVPPGTRFRLELLAENLSPDELGLVWLGIRELWEGRIQVGGFKGRGLGFVRLEKVQVHTVDGTDREALKNYITRGEMRLVAPEELERWLESFWNSCGGGKGA